MSSSKKKQVHYERGTKGGKSSHGHHSTGSRDSGVGSSSASDRASLGTSPEQESPFGHEQVDNQRRSVHDLREALRASNEEVERLKVANQGLSSLLSESNKDRRTLKRENEELSQQIHYLQGSLEQEKIANERSRRPEAPRSSATRSSSRRPERRTTPPKEKGEDESRRRDEKRSSWRNLPLPLYDTLPTHTGRPPTAPQPPPNNTNPFTPISPTTPHPFAPGLSRRGSVSYPPSASSASYAASSVSYPSSISYTGTGAVTYAAPSSFPATAPSTHRPGDRFPNDGKYHPYPI